MSQKKELNEWLDKEFQKAYKGTIAYQLEQLHKAFEKLKIAIIEEAENHYIIFALWLIGLLYILLFM